MEIDSSASGIQIASRFIPTKEMTDEFENLVCGCYGDRGRRSADDHRSQIGDGAAGLLLINRQGVRRMPPESGRWRSPQRFWRSIRSKRPQATGQEVTNDRSSEPSFAMRGNATRS